jgi:hypothetical protein
MLLFFAACAPYMVLIPYVVLVLSAVSVLMSVLLPVLVSPVVVVLHMVLISKMMHACISSLLSGVRRVALAGSRSLLPDLGVVSQITFSSEFCYQAAVQAGN